MFGHSKRRWSLGSVTIGLAVTVLLVISIGAGTGTAVVAVAPETRPCRRSRARPGWARRSRPPMERGPTARRRSRTCGSAARATGRTARRSRRRRQRPTCSLSRTRGRRSGFASRPRTPTAPPRLSPLRPASRRGSGNRPGKHRASHDHRPRQGRPDARRRRGRVVGQADRLHLRLAAVRRRCRVLREHRRCNGQELHRHGGISRLSPPRHGDGQERQGHGVGELGNHRCRPAARHGDEQAPVDRDHLGPLHRPGHLRAVPDLRRLPQERNDHRHGLASRSRPRTPGASRP